MTYIEFFEKTAVENVCACLAHAPQRVILLGDKLKLMKRHAQRYQELFAQRGQQIEFICRSVNKNNLQSIVDALAWIVERYEDCAFDLTGGEDLCLVAMGIVSQRFREKNIQMHRFNVRNGVLLDCDQDGTTVTRICEPRLTLAENIRIYGGDVVYEETEPGTTYRWQLDAEFVRDFEKLWEVCCQEGRQWNSQISTLMIAENINRTPEVPLTVRVDMQALRQHLHYNDRKLTAVRELAEKLLKAGCLTQYYCDDRTMVLEYKNARIRKCLSKAGQALEMAICLAAWQVTDGGQPVYNDVQGGVCIDWDGLLREEGAQTRNEIDVMMMHDLVPVFVSCKNGEVPVEELYKLHTVAERFGGRYAKKVLVATALDTMKNAEYIRTRAADMGIRLVENAQQISLSELQRIVKSFWCN